jgi:hypothetical protein
LQEGGLGRPNHLALSHPREDPKIGKFHYNLSVEGVYWAKFPGPGPKWGLRFGFVIMIPE